VFARPNRKEEKRQPRGGGVGGGGGSARWDQKRETSWRIAHEEGKRSGMKREGMPRRRGSGGGKGEAMVENEEQKQGDDE
jgi:hypothetical protein